MKEEELRKILDELKRGRELKIRYVSEESGRTDGETIHVFYKEGKLEAYARYWTTSNCLGRCPYCGEFYTDAPHCNCEDFEYFTIDELELIEEIRHCDEYELV